MTSFIRIPDGIMTQSLRSEANTHEGVPAAQTLKRKEVTRMGKIADAKAKRKERKAAREQRHEAREHSGNGSA